ncbi:MAG TPA: hypothetical protein VHT73_19490 [Thermodesulfobacteriota bacterium]|nr:hypothetical protein [Thermodesulfobacteriota bacterium]
MIPHPAYYSPKPSPSVSPSSTQTIDQPAGSAESISEQSSESQDSTVVLNTTVVPRTTVSESEEKQDKKTTVVKKNTVNKRNTVVRRKTVVEKNTVIPITTVVKRNTVEFVFFDALLSSEQSYWFNYVVAMHWILDYFIPTLPFRVSQVYLRLFRLAYGIKSNNGRCKVGYSSLIKACGISRKHLSISIRELEEMGAIKILERENKGRQGGGSSYQVLVPKEAAETVEKRTTVVKRNTVEKKTTVVENTTVVPEELYIYDDINNISTSLSKGSMMLPSDSLFESEWLRNYISEFPEKEQGRIKRLAERFDYFVLTGGKKKDWINNPTGTFISLVRNEINLKLPDYVPTFEERLEEQRQREEERLKEEQRERERESLKSEIRTMIEALQDQERETIIRRAREMYDIYHLATDEDVIERIVYKLLFDHDEGREWREGWEELKG